MSQRHRVLVVDDDPQTLAGLREVLSDHYSLSYATTGLQALEAASKVLPALILLDVNLPDIDGFEVCRRLKADQQTQLIPVLFVTSLNEGEFGVKGFSVGAVDYITKPIEPDVVVARVKSHISLVRIDRLERAYNDAISMLAVAGEYNDTDTGIHIRRMAAVSAEIARQAGWSPERAELMEQAAAMHDIGKLGIPGTILKKPGPLNTDEWHVMRQHPKIGHGILSVSEAPVFQLAAEIALAHHERWDGSGYPSNLAGDAIPESARIVAIADVLDALLSVRPYKKAWTIEETVAHIRADSGKHFDPALIDLFDRILPKILEVRERFNAIEEPEI